MAPKEKEVKSFINEENLEGMGFEDWPPEMILSELNLLEIQQFMGMIYGSLVRFYLPVVPLEILQSIKEDLIDLISSHTIKDEFGLFCLKLCRLGTNEDEKLLKAKFIEL